jgi:hypothetical protein
MKKSELHKIIREEIQNHLIEEGIVNWMLDKVATFTKNHFNHVADYQYARLLSSPDFRSLHKKFNMSEKDFLTKATSLVKQNPQKFADILAYDVRKGSFGKYFK